MEYYSLLEKKINPLIRSRLIKNFKKPEILLVCPSLVDYLQELRTKTTLNQYATIIIKQVKYQRNQKLFEASRAAYEIGRKEDI
ncbi:hypothetical protein P4G85_11970 [Bacillus cereus]|nr:hypothetical protein [Bacillus cereus]